MNKRKATHIMWTTDEGETFFGIELENDKPGRFVIFFDPDSDEPKVGFLRDDLLVETIEKTSIDEGYYVAAEQAIESFIFLQQKKDELRQILMPAVAKQLEALGSASK